MRWKNVEKQSPMPDEKASIVQSLEDERETDTDAEWMLPPATIAVASQRISDMYKNVIFPDESDFEEAHVEESLWPGMYQLATPACRTDRFLQKQPQRLQRNHHSCLVLGMGLQ